MNADRNIERLLASYLAEGPEWAPARALDAALDHAARHPRRRGPSSWLARLAGAGAWPVADRRLAWAPVLVAMALGLALVGALVLGGLLRPDKPPHGGLLVLAVGGDIWMVNPAVGKPTNITATPDIDESRARWSPDGSRLAVHTESRIDLMKADGRDRRAVTPELAGLDPDVAWLADGRRLVLAIAGRIMTVDVDRGPGSLAALTDQPGRGPVVSPDGSRIAFTGSIDNGDVYVVAAGGGAARMVVSLADLGYADRSDLEAAIEPAWSADGRSLLVRVTGSNATTSRLYRVAVASGATDLIREWTSIPEAAAVGPDGRLVGLTGTDLEIFDPLEPATGPLSQRWASAASPEVALGWSPDGGLIALANTTESCGESSCPVFVRLVATNGASPSTPVVTVIPAVQHSLQFPVIGGLDWQALPYPTEQAAYTADETCTTLSGGAEEVVGGVTLWHDVIVECRDVASDPRRSGARRLTAEYRFSPDGSATISGTTQLTTPGGTWEGSFSGTIADGPTGTHNVTATETGTGAYAGLVASFRVVGNGSVFRIEGTFAPAD